MGRPTGEMVDGWPMMGPLGKKEAQLLEDNLVPGEKVRGLVIGNFNQAIVATDQKILVLKTGLMSGQSFGRKATSFDYRTIVGVEVRTGWSQGEFEILSGGLANNQGNRVKDKVKMSEQPNGLVFSKQNAALFNAMAAKIREVVSLGHASAVAQSAPSVGETITESIEKLAQLHSAGILTEQEFTQKKAELLSRL